METKTCVTCNRELPIEDFYYSNRVTGARRAQCRFCHQAAKHDPSLRVGKMGRKRCCERPCNSCGRPFSPEEFSKNGKREDGSIRYASRCKQCDATHRHEQAKKYQVALADYNTIRLHEYLLGHPCVDCGETNPIVLEFDNVNGEKKRQISSMIAGYTWARIKEEMAKCEVRCRNCHFLRHQKENNNRMWRLVHNGKL